MNPSFLPTHKSSALSNYRSPRWSAIFAAIAALFFVAASNDARAQTDPDFITWTGSGTNWTSAANWNKTYKYGQLMWTGGGNATSWNDYGSTQSHWRFYFSGNTAYTLGGTAVHFFDFGGNNGGILSDSAALQTINMDVSLRDNGARSAFILTKGSGGLTFGGGVEVTNSVTVLGIGGANSGSIITMNGVVSGNKPVVVGTNSIDNNTTDMGNTRVVFAGNNTYTGATTVNLGALTISHANALGNTSAGTTVNSGGVLRLSGGITFASEALTLNGDGLGSTGALVNVSGNNVWGGAITLNSGARIGADANTTLTINGGISGNNPLYLGGAGNITIGGAISGTGSLYKDGAGVLTLASGNTYSGKTTNNTGTISIGAESALGATPGAAVADQLTFGGGTLATTATFALSANRGITLASGGGTFDVASATTLTVNGIIAGSGNGLTKAGSGILVLSGNNSYTGPTTISAGTLRLGASDRISSQSAISVASGATFDLNNLNDNVGGISGAGSITMGTGNLTTTVAANADFSGAITGSGTLTKAGANTLTLSGASSSYSGSIEVSAGALRVSNANALGNTTGGTTVTTGALELTGGVAIGSEALSLNADGVSAGGALRNISGDNSWAGTITIAGANTRINSDEGTLSLGGGLNFGSNTVYIGGGGNVTIGGAIQNGDKATGNGAFWWDGTGALRINTAPTLLSGGISLRRGTVLLGVDNALGVGAITAGAQGALTLASATTDARSIGNNITMSVSDRLNLGQSTGGTGNLTLGGNLAFSLTSANHYLNVASATTKATINGIISGTGKNLIKEGSGTLSLSGNNTYTGGTYIDAGTVEFTAGTSSASVIDVGTTGAATASAATLRFAPSGNYTLNQNITVQTGGDRTIDAANTAGVVTLGGNLTLGKNVDIRAAAGGGLALNGNITGNFTIGKRGTGTVTLGGTAAQGTKFDLWEGELSVSSAANLGNNTGEFIGNKVYMDGGALGVTGNVTLTSSNGITLGQAGGTIRVASGNTLTVQGFVNDQASLTGVTLSKTGTGTLFFDKTGVNDFSGTTLVINEGVVSTWNPALLPSGVQLGSSTAATSGTYRFAKTDGGVTANNNFTVNSGGGGIQVTDNTLTLGGTLSGSGNFSKTGAGSLTLTGNNGYSGALTVSEGTLQLNRTGGASLGSVGSINVAGTATLLISATSQVNNDQVEVTLSGGTITRGTGVSEVFGNLNVSAASFLNFGSGTAGSIEFGTYTRDTGSALLTVQNFFQGNSLVFSQNLVDLGYISASSTGSFNNGYFAFADGFNTSWNGSDTFTITAIPEPSTYVAAAGLLALFLWPVRRRLIKDAKSILGLRPTGRDRIEAYRQA